MERGEHRTCSYCLLSVSPTLYPFLSLSPSLFLISFTLSPAGAWSALWVGNRFYWTVSQEISHRNVFCFFFTNNPKFCQHTFLKPTIWVYSPQFNPEQSWVTVFVELRMFSSCSTSYEHEHASWQICYSELLQGVKKCVKFCTWCLAVNCCPIQSEFLSHAPCCHWLWIQYDWPG